MADHLDSIHHVAIPTTDIAGTVAWYRERFACTVLHQDETWAFLKFANTKLAFVTPGQHPAHVAFVVPEDVAAAQGELKLHRDATKSVYVTDPAGNAVEYLVVPTPTGDKPYGS